MICKKGFTHMQTVKACTRLFNQMVLVESLMVKILDGTSERLSQNTKIPAPSSGVYMYISVITKCG